MTDGEHRAPSRRHCPADGESDVYERYITDRLSETELAEFEEHMLACRRCQDEVRLALAIRSVASGARRTWGGGATGRRGFPRWLGLAAALVLVAGGVLTWRATRSSLPTGSSAMLAARVHAAAGVPNWDRIDWSSTRGGPAAQSVPILSFRVGSRLVDLRVARTAGDVQTAAALSREIALYLERIPFADAARRPFVVLGDALAAGHHADTLDILVDQGEHAARATLDVREFTAGQWCESGRLAALAGDTTFFRSAEFSRVLAAMREEHDWPEIAAVRALLVRRPGAAGISAVEAALAQLVKKGGG